MPSSMAGGQSSAGGATDRSLARPTVPRVSERSGWWRVVVRRGWRDGRLAKGGMQRRSVNYRSHLRERAMDG